MLRRTATAHKLVSAFVFHCLDNRIYEPYCEKTGLRGFRPGLTQTRLYSYRRWPEAWNFGFRKKRNCSINVTKTKALISFMVTVKLICIFVFAYGKCWFSHDEAQLCSLGGCTG